MELDVDGLSVAERYRVLIGCIAPRPIALVSTVSRDGRLNLAPFSFFTGIGSNPMTLLFCPVNTPEGGEKDTLRNAKPEAEGGVGEFVVNVAAAPIAHKMAAAAEPLPFGESEFEFVGLTPAPSRVVRPPRVAESPACFECRTRQVVRLNPGAVGGGTIVIGEVVHAFIRDGAVGEGLRIDAGELDAVARMGGITYCRSRDRFELPSGAAALRHEQPRPA
jgi:flavin reductase (DIM6/NTAB) family NADH-FMN oxidoreductase RutF